MLDVIGAGGMATVWRARDRALDRTVALKRPHPAPPGSDVHTRFDREARTAAAVSHPNLIAVYDVGHDDVGPYLVMEYVDGPSLADRRGAATDAALIGSQVAAGLAALHAAGIVHRDVKPGNVLLAADGAKLTDFGIARHTDATTLTQPGLVHATPAYAAPEVLAGAEPSPAADVYSTAVVVAELLTGGRSEGDPLAGLPTGWREVLGPALERDPARRPSATALSAALRRQIGRPLGAALAPTVAWTPNAVAEPELPGRRTATTALVAFIALCLAGVVIAAIALRDRDSSTSATDLIATDTTTAQATAAATTVAFGPNTTLAAASTPAPSPSVTPTTVTPTTEPAPPTSLTADTPEGTRQLIVAEVQQLDGDHDIDKLDKELGDAIRFSDEGQPNDQVLRRLRRAADLIGRSDDADPARQLLSHLSEQLGVDPAEVLDRPGPRD